MVYGKVYKALELGCQYTGVHPVEIMNGLVPKGTGKNTINHVHIKTFPSKHKQTLLGACSELTVEANYLIISLEIKGNCSKVNREEWMQITTAGLHWWKHLLAPRPWSLVSCYNQMPSVSVCVWQNLCVRQWRKMLQLLAALPSHEIITSSYLLLGQNGLFRTRNQFLLTLWHDPCPWSVIVIFTDCDNLT